MGPNGSGKSTLAYVLAGREGYEVTGGSVTCDGRTCWPWSLRSAPPPGCLPPSQYPVEIPGVANMYHLRRP